MPIQPNKTQRAPNQSHSNGSLPHTKATMGTTHRTISHNSSSSSSSGKLCAAGSSRAETVVTTRLGTTSLHSSRSSVSPARRQGLSLVLLLIAVAATSQRLFVSFVDIGDNSDRALLVTSTTALTHQPASEYSIVTAKTVHNDFESATSSTGNREPMSPSSLRSSSPDSIITASTVVTPADTGTAAVVAKMNKAEALINNVAAADMPYTPLSSSMTAFAPTKSPMAQLQASPTFPTTEYMATNLATDPDYPHYLQLSDLLMGPALGNDRNMPLKEAICEFRLVKYGKHFPHVYVYNNQ
jgi:hypothetical protein